ncbi:COBW domain-containing protein 1, partial [Nowakowskiella sp. JEL0078]
DSGVKAIENLMKKKGKFDYILLETTGLADPGPIANIFWVDEELGCDLYLDGIVTLIDAMHILQRLDENESDNSVNLATRQIALADRLILNKTDIVEKSVIESITSKIRKINSVAPLTQTVQSIVSLDLILDLHSFDGNERSLDIMKFDEHGSGDHIIKIINIGTVLLELKGILSKTRLEKWLQFILWEKKVPTQINVSGELSTDESQSSMNILRLKALVCIEGEEKRVIIQGVEELFDFHYGTQWKEIDDKTNKIVLIGENLDHQMFLKSLEYLV